MDLEDDDKLLGASMAAFRPAKRSDTSHLWRNHVLSMNIGLFFRFTLPSEGFTLLNTPHVFTTHECLSQCDPVDNRD